MLAEHACFKCAATMGKLASLNQGAFGPTQVGKFITVYPRDDAQAMRLAAKLDEATRGLRGPAVPTDRPLRAGSLVHYRYGAFSAQLMQLPSGEVVPTITTPDGTLQPDRRFMTFSSPEWVSSPFPTFDRNDAGELSTKPVGGRYLRIALLHQSAKGSVWMAADILGMRRCVLKQSRRDALLNDDGRDAGDSMRHEAEILTYLAPDPRFPRLYDLLEEDGDLFLAMEDMSGVPLERLILDHFGMSAAVPNRDLIRWGRSLAEALGAMHGRGLVHRDLKPSNVMISPAGEARLIDLELAYGPAFAECPVGKGTRGYVSPSQDRLETPEPADDIYSLGALLYFAATQADPSLAPNPHFLLDRPPTLLNPACDPGLAAIITRCLDPDPSLRFPSMSGVADALGTLSLEPREAPALGHGVGVESGMAENERAGYSEEARRLGDTLCHVARSLPNSDGKVWHSAHLFGGEVPGRDLAAGTAGVVLALAELTRVFGRAEHREALAAGARGLVDASPLEGDPPAGLLVGEAGIGAAWLRAGQVLADPT
ncbi:MAG: protein kinase domain-containing protein, partial [Chloroflexota bacterium]